jgi:hypothetical protein
MVEGVFSRRASNTIRPIELGRRLIREMDDQRSVDVTGRRVVPNDFVVQLAQKDFEGFAEIADVLQTELVEAARRVVEDGIDAAAVDPSSPVAPEPAVSELTATPEPEPVAEASLKPGDVVMVAKRLVPIPVPKPKL